MGELIIFSEVEKMALNPSLENLVLFGEPDFLKGDEGVYDLIFHAKQTDPYSVVKPDSLVIPVLRLEEYEESLAIETVYNAYLQHPDFDRYSVAADSLSFYQIVPKEHGKEIKVVGKYKKVSKRAFFNFVDDSLLKRELTSKKRVIDKRYHAAF